MSQERNVRKDLSDSDEDETSSGSSYPSSEKTDVSTVDLVITIESDSTSQNVTDEDSSSSYSTVTDATKTIDEVKSAYLKHSCDKIYTSPSSSTPQSTSKQVSDLSLPIKTTKQADVQQELKSPGTPTKRFRPLEEKAETQPYSKRPKSLPCAPTELSEKSKKRKDVISEPISLFLPDFFSTSKFEVEFAKTESKEIPGCSTQLSSSTRNYSRDYARPGPSRQTAITISSPDKSKQVGALPKTRSPTTPTKRQPTSDETLESQPDCKKRVIDPVSGIKPEQQKRSSKSNSPDLPQVITPEKFEKEFDRAEGKEMLEILKEQTRFTGSAPSTSKSSPSLSSEGPKKKFLRRSQSEMNTSGSIVLESMLSDTSTSKLGKLLSDFFQSPTSSVQPIGNTYREDPHEGSSSRSHSGKPSNREDEPGQTIIKNPLVNAMLDDKSSMRESDRLSFDIKSAMGLDPKPDEASNAVANVPRAADVPYFLPYNVPLVQSRTETDIPANQSLEEDLNASAIFMTTKIMNLEADVEDFGNRINDNRLLSSLGIPLPDSACGTNRPSSPSHSQGASSSPSSDSPQSTSRLNITRLQAIETHRRILQEVERRADENQKEESLATEDLMEIFRTFEFTLREILDDVHKEYLGGAGPFTYDLNQHFEKFLEDMDELYKQVRIKYKKQREGYPNYDEMCNSIEKNYHELRELFSKIATELERLSKLI